MLLQMESLHSFYGWVVFRCIWMYNSLISAWTLGYFHVLTMVNNAVMNMEVHIFFWIMVFSDICPLTPILMSTFIPHPSLLLVLLTSKQVYYKVWVFSFLVKITFPNWFPPHTLSVISPSILGSLTLSPHKASSYKQ